MFGLLRSVAWVIVLLVFTLRHSDWRFLLHFLSCPAFVRFCYKLLPAQGEQVVLFCYNTGTAPLCVSCGSFGRPASAGHFLVWPTFSESRCYEPSAGTDPFDQSLMQRHPLSPRAGHPKGCIILLQPCCRPVPSMLPCARNSWQVQNHIYSNASPGVQPRAILCRRPNCVLRVGFVVTPSRGLRIAGGRPAVRS